MSYVIMDNTMDGFLSILILIIGAAGAALIAFFFGKVHKKDHPDDEDTN